MVMQRPAKPSMPVRFRPSPPVFVVALKNRASLQDGAVFLCSFLRKSDVSRVEWLRFGMGIDRVGL